jgi:hypothetical protein
MVQDLRVYGLEERVQSFGSRAKCWEFGFTGFKIGI